MTSDTQTRSRCKQCGNELPPHGICYVCAQIERNNQRYGARPDHNYLGLGERRRITAPALPPGVKDNIASKQTRVHTQPSPQPQSSTIHYPPAPYEAARLQDVRAVRRGINRFLEATHQRPMLLSQILADGGLHAGKIQCVRENMDLYLNSLIKYWCGHLKATLTDRQFEFLIRVYALDGKTDATVRDMLTDQASSERYVQKRINNALTCLRTPEQLQVLDRIAVDIARKL